MHGSSKQIVEEARSGKQDQLARVSERKLRANRENAKKSTGPKTIRGKSYSRKNAFKHGLFAMHVFDFDILEESRRQYEELLDGLWEQYQPVGSAEELEVERVALCWWRLKRAWRYENVVNRIARRDLTRAELDYQKDWWEKNNREDSEVIALLQNGKKEIEDRGEIPVELRQKIAAASPGFECVLAAIEQVIQDRVKQPEIARDFRHLSRSQQASVLASCNVKAAIGILEELREKRYHSIMEVAVGQNAIPGREQLDKILRYETTIERQLSRSVDRLERLQRRRQGEMVPPPLRVHLTQ